MATTDIAADRFRFPEYRSTDTCEAVQWDESRDTLKKLQANGMRMMRCEGDGSNPDLCKWLQITTISGTTDVRLGDWIVAFARGAFTVMTDEAFNRKYQPKDQPLQTLVLEAMELVCSLHGRIPEGYTVTLELTGDECSLSVADPDGDDVHFDHDHGEPGIMSAIDAAVAHNMEAV